MEHVRFALPSGRTQTLRPVLAMKVATLMAGHAYAPDGRLPAGPLADAARRVRDGYRCRDARRDLRLVSLLAVEGVAERQGVEMTCDDPDTARALREALAGG